MSPARVLSIAGSDPGGGAGIQADVKTITVLGGYGMSVITALTVQNTMGVREVFTLPTDFVIRQLDALLEDIGVDAIKTGMLPNREMVREVARKIAALGLHTLVVDPVLAAKRGEVLMDKDTIPVMMSELFPLARVVTPNIPEAEVLTGLCIRTPGDMRKAAVILRDSGAGHVVVKGGHLGVGEETVDILYDGRTFYEFPAKRIDRSDTHGTGCVYASAIATFLAAGCSVPEAVKSAKNHVTAAILNAWRLGRGSGPVNHFPPPAAGGEIAG